MAALVAAASTVKEFRWEKNLLTKRNNILVNGRIY